MPLSKTQIERNTFVAGLITEASPLTFPENASLDERNFVLNRDGSRQRRLGMDKESNGVWLDTGETPLTFDNFNINTYVWENVANDPTKTFGVVQVGKKLWIVDLQQDVLSGNVKNGGVPFEINLTTSQVTISGNARMDFASINGKLVIASQELPVPRLFEYDFDADQFKFVKAIGIKVRDIWGVDDGLDVNEEPVTLSPEHEYNLYNQGWPEEKVTVVAGPNSRQFAHENYRSTVGVYPGNHRVWFAGKTVAATSNGLEVFGPSILRDITFGTTPAAKGSKVIDAFFRGTSRLNQVPFGTGLPLDREEGAFTLVESFAGRVFYSGVESEVTDGDGKSPDYSGMLFFTGLVQNVDDLGKCHSINDPSSEYESDLLPTDGGTIKIIGAGNILKLISTENSLVVICDNGIWEVSGPDGVFKANDFSVRQVTTVGCSSKGSVILVEGSILYWGDGGIYVLSPDQISGRLSPTNLTESTIQTLYTDIPSVGRANALGNYDVADRKVRWLYNDTDDYDGSILRKRFNKELVFDTVLKAFYINEIYDAETDSPFVAGYLPTKSFNVVEDVQSVVHNGDQVQVNGEDVTVTRDIRSRGNSQTKYLAFKPNEFSSNYGMAFSLYTNNKFKDWDEVDAAAYLITGYEIFGDTARKKQANYLVMHFLRTETGFEDDGEGGLIPLNESRATVQAQWDFANSINSGKWGTPFEAYRLRRAYFPTGTSDTFDYGWKVITTKNRLRGSGRALSIRVDSSPEKDLYLLGWHLDVVGGTRV